MMRYGPLFALLVAASGCADYAMSSEEPGGTENDADVDVDSGLRLDVYPAADLTVDDLPLLPQTFFTSPDTGGDIVLEVPVVVQGTLSAYDVSPWADADLPGDTVPMGGARVTISRPGTVQGATDVTGDGGEGRLDQPGEYLLRVPPSRDYLASFVADDPEIPFWSGPLSLPMNRRFDMDLGHGATVWGEVLTSAGTPVAGAAVYATDANGVSGAVATTDANGFYLLRVTADATYTLTCSGREDGLDPTLVAERVAVGDSGAPVDFVYEPRDLRTVRGRLVDEDGEGLSGVTARFVARSVEGYGPDASFQIEFPTIDGGHFFGGLLPGEYDVLLVPEGGVSVSPAAIEVTVDETLEELGDLTLPDLVQVDTIVLDTRGNFVPGALVTVSETGFGGRVWQAASDASGRLLVDAPQVPVTIELTPPPGLDLAIARVEADSGADVAELILDGGERIEGTVSWRDEDGTVRPAAFAIVEARDDAGRRLGVAFTDGDGAYSMTIAP